MVRNRLHTFYGVFMIWSENANVWRRSTPPRPIFISGTKSQRLKGKNFVTLYLWDFVVKLLNSL